LESVAGRNAQPEAIEIVLAKLLRKNPVERYQTLLELRGDLEKVQRGESVQPFYMSRTQQSPSRAEANQPEAWSRQRSSNLFPRRRALDFVQASPTEQSIPCIDKFESLQILHVMIDSDLVASLASLSNIKNLGEFYLVGEANIDPVLNAIRNAPHLHKLKLQIPHISSEGFTCISSMPHLENCELSTQVLSDPKSTNRLLTILSSAPKLQRAQLERLCINADTIRILRSLKALKSLSVTAATGSATDDLIRKLHSGLPNIIAHEAPGRGFYPNGFRQ
jgi:hypothetical protein